MITFLDPGYLPTKRVKQGKARCEFGALADWIAEEFGVRPLNIVYERLGAVDRPRIEVIFEHHHEDQLFRADDGFNWDEEKLGRIGAQFKSLYPQYDSERLFVISSSFAHLAMAEAVSQVPKRKIERLKRELGLWEISSFGSYTVFFVNTEAQLRAVEESPLHKEWSQKFIDLVRRYDELGYFPKDANLVKLDSKERFDREYKGNWYGYWH